MNPFSLGLIFAAVTTYGLALAVWIYRPKRSPMHIFFIFYLLSIGFWATFSAIQTLSYDATVVSKAVIIMHWGAIFIAIFFLHFIYFLTKAIKKSILYASYFTGIIFLFLNNFSKLFVADIMPKKPFHFFMKAGPLYFLFIVFFGTLWSYSVIHLYTQARRSESLQKKKQLQLLFIGSLIGYLGGSGAFLPVYNWSLPIIYPYGNFAIGIYVAIMTYAIVKHRLMDIDVIIRRTVVFAGLLTFVFGIFSAATFIVQELLERFGLGKTWTYVISLFVIVLGYDPIRNILVNITDKYLFQKKYNYQELLKDASRGMSKIESLHKLLGLVVHFITMRMRVKNAAVMMRRRDREFELGYQRGFNKNFLEYRMDETNPMIMYLKREKEAIDVERIREYMEAGNKKKVKGDKPHEYDFHAILLTMEELNAACAVPSFLGHELQNILLIGEKKSGDYYTQEDLNVLFTLAQESAIAIENAKLFDEAVKKSSQLEKINEQLEYSRNLLMKALRETEIANKQLQDTQAQLIHEQKMATLGRLAASVGHEVNNPLTILSMNVSRAILKYRKNPDLRVGEVLDLFQKMEQNIGRIKAVVNTLTGLLKRSEKGKFEPLSLKLILEETLPLVQFQTYLDNLTGTEVDFDIPGNVPLVRGDLERLQEVFLNLFINAYHAMMGKRNRRIRVTAEMDPENPHNVAVHFTDNGCGMTEEVMKKIFNYGFTTKPPGRGSGMGLYMCKYIIELHGGDIRVKSKVGEGTTFTITLPAYEEGMGDSSGPIRIEATS